MIYTTDIIFHRLRNLRDIRVSSKLPEIPSESSDTGFYQCPAKKCHVCNYAIEGKKCTSSQTNEIFPITTLLHSKMDWMIYLITCKKCIKQYVGITRTSLYTRFTNTKSDIKCYKTDTEKSLPIAHHFHLPNHSNDNVLLQGIEKIHTKRDCVIPHRESFWICKLKTLTPHGIMLIHNLVFISSIPFTWAVIYPPIHPFMFPALF